MTNAPSIPGHYFHPLNPQEKGEREGGGLGIRRSSQKSFELLLHVFLLDDASEQYARVFAIMSE